MSMEEIWKDIEGYEGLYQVSNLGRVSSSGRNIMRRTRYGTIAPYHIAGRVLKPSHSNGDYCYVHLFDKDGVSTNYKVHRLVALAFVPNPDNLNEVNHIDEDKENNRADNLEWVKHVDNCNHGTRNERSAAKRGRRVEQLTLDGKHVAFYQSVSEASRQTGIGRSNIGECLGRRSQTAGGFSWKFKE